METKELAENFFGESLAKFDQVNAQAFAFAIVGKHFHTIKASIGSGGISRVIKVLDVKVCTQKSLIAVMLKENSWGSSGGVEWGFHLYVHSVAENAETSFYIYSARCRSSEDRDLKEFWYNKIYSLDYKDNTFVVKFENDGKFWHMENGKSYWIMRNNSGRVIAHEILSTLEAKKGEETIIINDVPELQLEQKQEEFTAKGYIWSSRSANPPEFPVGKIWL